MSEEPEELKDVFAHFGLTFSLGCNIEAVLANLILMADFVKKVLSESKEAGKPIYTQHEATQRLEKYLDEQHAKTMGKLIGGEKLPGGVKEFIELDPEIDKRLDDALRRRNYLAHNFWRERGGEVLSIRRRPIVQADLVADQHFFEELARDLEALAFKEVSAIGLDADKLESKVEQSVKRAQSDLAQR